MSIETLSIEICSIWKIGYWVREIFIIKSFSSNLICQLFSLYTYLIYIRIFFIYVTKKLAHMLYATLSLCHNFCKKFWFNFFKINKYICSDIFEHNYHPVYIISCDTFTGTKAIHLSTYLYGLNIAAEIIWLYFYWIITNWWTRANRAGHIIHNINGVDWVYGDNIWTTAIKIMIVYLCW